MTVQEAISHYGNITRMADSLGISRQTVYLWKGKKRIPFSRQTQIEVETKGKLKARSI